MKEVKLRGHHLICLNFFVGLGYNREFTINLQNIVGQLNRGAPIKVIEGYDEVCLKCPWLTGDACSRRENSEEKVNFADVEACRLLHLRAGDRIFWGELKERIPGIWEIWHSTICSDCEWKKVCEIQVQKTEVKHE